ncbi:ABC-2 type transport system ATP-binding protein [Friedmanniella endophytica]|uniref:ABC-2 type transport system ATP-binding protein n=1 Tax=Microlunatus kandeliicorticis TaxID=1759536 RepID=A0A7W3P4Q7_9ACTN|nr:ABC transporter ATP-binding protein [Microlunatus kandeliicorticis]MBA8793154.1 ABC-2 type transport system ATP-binding protein [Microlunatus kandeliicorticis]
MTPTTVSGPTDRAGTDGAASGSGSADGHRDAVRPGDGVETYDDDTADAPIRTTGLTKRFRHQTAVDAVDLLVPRGAVYGFLGPNGSGKTTTIRMILGLIRATSGSIRLLGAEMPSGANQALPRVGALVEGPAFHPYLSGRANLARLDAVDRGTDPRTSRQRIDAALDRVGLLPAAEKRFRAYSLGMRQRLAIANALLTPRELLVLDEPTNGLDPQGTREVRHLVSELAADGVTVLISSHLLSEVEQICTHIGVMHVGRLLSQGSVEELRSRSRPTVTVRTDQPDRALTALTALGMTDLGREGPGGTHVVGPLGEVDPRRIVPALVAEGADVLGFAVDAPSLEDLFVELTGEGFDVSG